MGSFGRQTAGVFELLVNGAAVLFGLVIIGGLIWALLDALVF